MADDTTMKVIPPIELMLAMTKMCERGMFDEQKGLLQEIAGVEEKQ